MEVIQQIQTPEIQGKVYAACYKLTKSHEAAIELRQDVMFFALRKIHLYKEEGKLIHWLRMITRNTFINQYRKKKNRPEIEFLDWKSGNERNAGEYADEVAQVWKAVGKLPRKSREAIELLIDGCKYEEIAETQNASMGTVKSRIFNARKQLAEMLNTQQ